MRVMHIDFCEESYWKRYAAAKLAISCKNSVIQKIKERKTKRVNIEIIASAKSPVHEEDDYVQPASEEHPGNDRLEAQLEIGGFNLNNIDQDDYGIEGTDQDHGVSHIEEPLDDVDLLHDDADEDRDVEMAQTNPLPPVIESQPVEVKPPSTFDVQPTLFE